MRDEAAANRAIRLYADTVRRICFVHLKNYADTENAFQEIFLKYVLNDTEFESAAHEKAWIIRVAVNTCKDTVKNFFRRKTIPLEDAAFEPFYMDEQEKEVLDAVLRLPQNYRNAVYLFYYEGYTVVEIAKLLNKKTNTVYTWVDRARKQLRNSLGGDSVG